MGISALPPGLSKGDSGRSTKSQSYEEPALSCPLVLIAIYYIMLTQGRMSVGVGGVLNFLALAILPPPYPPKFWVTDYSCNSGHVEASWRT